MGLRAGVLNLPSAAQAGAGNTTLLAGNSVNGLPYGLGLSVEAHDELDVDVNLTSGTSVTFTIERLGLDGVWYAIANSGAITAAAWSTTLAGQNSASQGFGNYIRLKWDKACTFSASIVGK